MHDSEINYLNLHDMRRMEHCPPHFLQVFFELAGNEKSISDWIYENLSGRFYFGNWYKVINGYPIMHFCAAFENHSEASYFSLVLSEINRLDTK